VNFGEKYKITNNFKKMAVSCVVWKKFTDVSEVFGASIIRDHLLTNPTFLAKNNP
jgi:hypothetical protein